MGPDDVGDPAEALHHERELLVTREERWAEERPLDGGYTVIELVVAIGILGVVMVALATLMFTSVSVDTETGRRLDDNRAQRVAAVYFASDAQAARAGGGVATSGSSQCGSEPMLVEFRGDSFSAPAGPAPGAPSPEVTVVTYVLRPVTVDGTPAQDLHRLACQGPSSPALPLTPSSDVAVARGLAVSGQTITVSGTAAVLTLTPLHGSPFNLVGTRRTT
jgi:type II secretory pathway pseudopilin PulG